MLTYQLNGRKFRYWTKLKIKKEAWQKQMFRINYKSASENNSILEDLKNDIKEIEREAIFNKKEFSLEIVKRKFLLKQGNLSEEAQYFH